MFVSNTLARSRITNNLKVKYLTLNSESTLEMLRRHSEFDRINQNISLVKLTEVVRTIPTLSVFIELGI